MITNSIFGKPQNNWIKATCVVDMFNVGNDEWPTEFRVLPNAGDFVESKDGRMLKIVQVTHKHGDYEPQVVLRLGMDNTSVTPMEGGGAAVSMESE